MNTLIGDKIRNFRKRAEMSQLELEVAIGAATGSISRVESGDVNPSKETLVKIIESLNLNMYDAADLFDINVSQDPVEKIISEVNGLITEGLSKQQIYDLTTQRLVKLLNVDYCGFLVLDDEGENIELVSVDIPSIIYGFVEKFIGRKTVGLKFPLRKEGYDENHYVRTVVENRIIETDNFYNHTRPVIPEQMSDLVAKYMDFSRGIALPLSHNGKVLGCIGLMWKSKSVSIGEHKVLQAFAKQIALALIVTDKK